MNRITFDGAEQAHHRQSGLRVIDGQDQVDEGSRTWVRDQGADGYVPLEDWIDPAQAQRRAPRIPLWLRDAEMRREVLATDGRRIAGWLAWTATAGLLVAYVRLWATVPRGLARLVGSWWHWLIDDRRYAESREDLHLTGKGDPVAIQEGHQARQRSHLFISLAGLVVVAAATGWHLSVAALVSDRQLLAVAAIAGPLLGWVGRDETSSPLIDALRIEASTTPPVTIDLIVAALIAIGAVKERGPQPRVVQPPARTRTGWETIVDLPAGADVETVVKRRSRFAGALQRRAECVWLSEAPGDDSHAARLRVVVNRRPLRSMPMPEWPFRRGGSFNYFTDPVPVGINELGEPVGDRKAYRSTVYGGLMGSGKTVSMINSVLAQAVDPRVELHINDLKGGSDWLPLAGIAHFFRSGTDPEDEEAILDDLRQLNRRMASRFKTLQTLPEEHRSPRTTDGLASTRGLDLHPIIIAIDETSEMFQYSDHRDEYEALVARIIKRGRGVAITVEAGTQEVVKPALPIAGLCHYRHCHAVNGHGAVDLVLGTGAYNAGFDAAALTAADVGIGYFGSGKSISLARSYFLAPDGPEGDEVKDVCDRLREERQAAGLLTGMAAGELEPDDQTDGAPEHVLAVWPGMARAVAYEDLIEPLARTWPGLYGSWVDLEAEEASRALSTALGPDIASVTVAAGKGSRRPRGVTLAAIQAAVDARRGGPRPGDTTADDRGDLGRDIDSGRFRVIDGAPASGNGDNSGWESEAGA